MSGNSSWYFFSEFFFRLRIIMDRLFLAVFLCVSLMPLVFSAGDDSGILYTFICFPLLCFCYHLSKGDFIFVWGLQSSRDLSVLRLYRINTLRKMGICIHLNILCIAPGITQRCQTKWIKIHLNFLCDIKKPHRVERTRWLLPCKSVMQ